MIDRYRTMWPKSMYLFSIQNLPLLSCSKLKEAKNLLFSSRFAFFTLILYHTPVITDFTHRQVGSRVGFYYDNYDNNIVMILGNSSDFPLQPY